MKQQSYVLVFISILLICGIVHKSDAAPDEFVSADSLWEQVRKHYKSSPILALDYANELQKVAKAGNNKIREANALWSMGILNKKLGNYNKSVEAYFKVLPIYKELGDTKNVAIAYYNIAKIFTETKNDVSALAFYKNSLGLYTQINYKKGIVKAHIQLGKSFVNLKDYKKADKHLHVALKLASNKYLPLIYNWLGLLETDKGNYEKAIDYFNTSLSLNEKENDLSEKAATLLNIGRVHSITDNLKAAKEYAIKSLTLAKKINDIDKQTKPQILLAEIAYKQKGGNIAEVNALVTTVRDFNKENYNAYLQEGLYYLSEDPQQNILERAGLKEMMKLLAAQGKLSSALYEKTKILLNQHSLQLSIEKIKNEQKLEALEESDKFKSWAFGIGALLLIGMVVWVLEHSKYKRTVAKESF